MEIKCECCRKKNATIKDFRFIEGVAQGKVLVCQRCFNLDDVTFYKVASGDSFYLDDE